MNDQSGISSTDAPEPIAEVPIAPLVETAPATVTGSVTDLMTKDEFFMFFSSSFTVSASIVGAIQPPPLQTLMKAGELQTARPAADALYDMAAKFSWLEFLIRKEGQWVASVAVLGAFGIQLSTGIIAELEARKPAPVIERDMEAEGVRYP